MSDDKIDDKINDAIDKADIAATSAKGHIKDAVGGLTGDLGMQADGKIDQLAAAAREEFADLYDEGETKLEQAIALVRERPLVTLGVVSVVGVILGWLLFPRRKA